MEAYIVKPQNILPRRTVGARVVRRIENHAASIAQMLKMQLPLVPAK
jgi:hypothetical protein